MCPALAITARAPVLYVANRWRHAIGACALVLLSATAYAQGLDAELLEWEAKLRDLNNQVAELDARWLGASAEDRELLAARKGRLAKTYRVALWEFADLVHQHPQKDTHAAASHRRALRWLQATAATLKQDLLDLEAHFQQPQKEPAAASGESTGEAPDATTDWPRRRRLAQTKYDELLTELITNAQKRSQLGDNAQDDFDHATQKLKPRADLLSGRIELHRRERESLRQDLSNTTYDSEAAKILQNNLNAIEAQLNSDAQKLNRVADLLETLGQDTAFYRQTAFLASGQLSAEYFGSQTLSSIFNQWLAYLKTTVIKRAPQWISQAIVISCIVTLFWLIARLVKTVLRRWLAAHSLGMSNLARDFMVGMSSKVVLLIGILIGLSQIGLQIGPLLAGLGIVGFIVGFALQDTLSNFASGMMILIYRPFDEGDYINAAGVEGSVHRMNLVSTTIYTPQNHRLIIPNSKIWGDIIRNITSQPLRRVDMVFGVGYADDIEKVERVLQSVVDAHPLVMPTPETVVRVNALADSAVEFIVRAWVKSENYLQVYWDMQKQVKLAFDREGISIPYPHREVILTHAQSVSTPADTPAAKTIE